MWSDANRDCSRQDFLFAKRTWLFFLCSIAAKKTMGDFAAVSPAEIVSRAIAVLLFSFCIFTWFICWYIHVFSWYLVFIYYIYILYIHKHIFLYLCLVISWEWCDPVIILSSQISLLLNLLRKNCFIHVWLNTSWDLILYFALNTLCVWIDLPFT